MAYIMPGEEQMKPEELNFKEKYRSLKRKMRFLIYEQECFQEELRRAQRKLLKISRDKNFLLDRLLQYERVIDPGTDSDSTLSSEDSCKETKKTSPKEQEKKVVKKKRRPKKKPTQRLQGMPLLGANRDPLAHDLHSPPPALHQQLPHLAELMRKAAEGLPITQAPTMQVPGSTSGSQDPHQQPPLPSPHSHHPLLSPHHLHPSLLSPTGVNTLGLPPGLSSLPHSIDPRVFDRGLHQAWSGLSGLAMGGAMGHMMGDAGLPHLDLNALTHAAALDKVAQQEKSKKKSKKDSSDKHGSSSHGHSSSHSHSSSHQHQIAPPLHSSSSTQDNNEDLVIDVPESKR